MSMRICGIELTGNDAVVCLLDKDDGLFNLPDSRTRKLTLKKDHTREDLLAFQKELVQFLGDYKVQRVVIKERLQKGKLDRKSTRLNSSHVRISYAVFCLKKKKI